MVTIRTFEEQVRQFHRSGLVPGLVHLYSGQEAVAVGACAALLPADKIASHHRGHGHCIAKGGRMDQLFAEILGRRSAYGLGRGGSMHIFDPKSGNLGTTVSSAAACRWPPAPRLAPSSRAMTRSPSVSSATAS